MGQAIRAWQKEPGSMCHGDLLAWPLALTIFLLSAGPLAAQDRGVMIDASLNPLEIQNLRDTPGHKNHIMHVHDATLLCNAANYGIRYCACPGPPSLVLRKPSYKPLSEPGLARLTEATADRPP
jgi:hypothetical protein